MVAPLSRLLAPLAALLLGACATVGTPPAPGRADAGGLVSAADPRAAEAGAAMLRAGGSATDAAIATMLALTVVEPQSSGIGGGGFYLHTDASGRVETLDGRETAPMAASPTWFLRDGKPLTRGEAVPGGLSVGVPGNLRLAAEAHARHGRRPWADLFAPAIALARDGFVVSPRLNEFLGRAKRTGALDADARALFYYARGEPVAAGATVRNPALAATLERLAARGADSFYVGPDAQAIVAEVSRAPANPAPLAAGDLAAYTAKWRDPVCAEYRRHRICGMGPPSSGATTVYAILKQLERFDIAALGPQSPTFWHLFAESQRLAFADREAYLADPDYVSVPVAGLVDANYLSERGKAISPDRALPSVAAGTPPGTRAIMAPGRSLDVAGTSHFVAVDRRGNAVSYTSTIEGAFGSGLMTGGFYLNNELTDFSLVPEVAGVPVANRVEAGKRPRSSMAPTLVFGPNGKLRLAVGAAGGSTIIAQTAKAIIGVVDFGLPAAQAIALPQLFAPGGAVTVEQGSALEAMIPALLARGHAQVRAAELPLKANAIERVRGRWVGVADPRSEGTAVAE